MDVCKLPSLTVQSKPHTAVKLMFPDTDLRARESGVWALESDSSGLKTQPIIYQVCGLEQVTYLSSSSIPLSSIKQGLVLQ